MSAWTDHYAKCKDCRACPLCDQRDRICLARSEWPVGADRPNLHLPCDVLFIGEAPGATEDSLGLPFTGPAGGILDQIIARAVPPTVRIAFTNLVACFPGEAKARGDNEPEIAEIKACRPRLEEFITLAAPKLVVLVGTLAQSWVQHDAWGLIHGAQTVDIIHPAATMGSRMPAAQKQSAIHHATVRLRNAVAGMLKSMQDGVKPNAVDNRNREQQGNPITDDIPF